MSDSSTLLTAALQHFLTEWVALWFSPDEVSVGGGLC